MTRTTGGGTVTDISARMRNYIHHYIMGVALFSFGMGFAFGFFGVVIAVGVVIMLGAFGAFLLVQVQDIVKGNGQ